MEEIARQKRVSVGTEEAAPGLVVGSSRRGRQAVSTQDAADRPGGNPVPQAAQLALDPLVSPAGEMLSSTFSGLCGAGDYGRVHIIPSST